MSDDSASVDVNARDIVLTISPHGQVVVGMTYFKLPPDVQTIHLTLTMEAAQMEEFAKRLLAKAQEARAANVKH